MLILAVTYFPAVVVFFRILSRSSTSDSQVGVWVTPIMWNFSDLGLTGLSKDP